MITVIGYSKKQRKDGETFLVLNLIGGLELVQSQTTGNWYGVVRKTTIPANFDEETAKMVVGTKLPGTIVRIQSEPWNYTDQRSGEIIQMTWRWAFQPEGAIAPVPEVVDETEFA